MKSAEIVVAQVFDAVADYRRPKLVVQTIARYFAQKKAEIEGVAIGPVPRQAGK